MSDYLSKVRQFFLNNHQIEVSSEDLDEIKKIILTGSQAQLQQIEEGLCQKQRENCAKSISEALDKYYHPGMSLMEIQKIVQNVASNRAETPNVTDTVRFLIVGS
jgi:hypothetical protein